MKSRTYRQCRWQVVMLVAAAASAAAQSRPLPLKHAPRESNAEISAADLMTRLYIFADDSMMGRLAGSIYNEKGNDYIARELKKMGVQPGGEDGSYFQEVPLVTMRVSTAHPLTVDGRQFFGGKDFLPRTAHAFNDERVVYGGVLGPDTTHIVSSDSVAGRVVVLATPIGANGKPTCINTRQPASVRYRNASAVWVVCMDGMTDGEIKSLMETSVLVDPANRQNLGSPLGFGYVTGAMAEAMLGASLATMKPGAAGKTIRGSMTIDTVNAPERNVIGIIPGSDPRWRGEYVAIGAHNDHVGFQAGPVDHDSVKAFNQVARPMGVDSVPRTMTPAMTAEFHRRLEELRKQHPARVDSIYNGADDDGSGSVSALEIAEFFAKSTKRPKRSLIFVWHAGEEFGLFGSTYFTDHPTVPRDSIVAQLNMDMVGRGRSTDVTGRVKTLDANGRPMLGAEIHGGPDYLQLVGSRRLSTELGDLVESVNAFAPHPFRLDYSIDADGHPTHIYCRSDHYAYARYGIPVTYFTTGLHSDYHQVTDEPEYIDYDHMARVATLVKEVAVRVANLDHRVVVNKPKPDPRGACVQ